MDRGVDALVVLALGTAPLPAAILYGLALITRGGAFDRQRRSYADNVVVRALPEPPAPEAGPGT